MWFYQGKEFTDEQIQGNFGFVYLIKYANGKKYIGQKYFHADKGRWHEYVGGGEIVKSYIKKYGKVWVRENAERFIVHLGKDEDDLNKMEEWLIEWTNAVESDDYWNLKPGGKNSSHSEVSRQKIRRSMTGKVLTVEHKKKISDNLKINTWNSYPISVIFNNGNIINFESMNQFASSLNIGLTNIRRWRKGIRPVPDKYDIEKIIW